MGLFNDAAEMERRQKLKELEDKRVAFSAELVKQGFAPNKMFCVQTANGGFVALANDKGQRCLIIGPGFGTDEEFVLERYETMNVRKEEVLVASEGMAGIFGFGKKGEIGAEYIITRHDGSEISLPVVGGRNSWLEYTSAKKNPLLSTKRRRGDANIVWDFKPVEKRYLKTIFGLADEYLGL